MKKKSIYLFFLLLAGASLIACDKDDAETNLTFDKNTITLSVDETDTVKVSGGSTPYTAVESDATVVDATVSSAKIAVKGLKVGNTTIKVTDKNGVNATFAVKVEE
ncbi:MAG: pilus assembly protein N-terminal domain-containing protein [Proteiniphilum sp.]|jgi:hypothetical protein|nr:pilus assembly protein N-terminal domain-containing protein [Proteiniphilum sp.]NCD14458.1 hypothetical protein [Bacteroidia bacterium]HHT35212.1 hypothetical protein [Bacteroidales bacterium]MDD2726272.1 pilus assembly protein N-terminal domain-containing protein [Proteiniphilum sp.]MDD3331616.1 pilus assembly protein N-terminal domain-containing protein [Proteiniphilum sp.]